jgi:hypothetical protein
MTDCPNCEYHRQRAQLWRDEAYKQAGHPLPEREDDYALIDAGLLNSTELVKQTVLQNFRVPAADGKNNG